MDRVEEWIVGNFLVSCFRRFASIHKDTTTYRICMTKMQCSYGEVHEVSIGWLTIACSEPGDYL